MYSIMGTFGELWNGSRWQNSNLGICLLSITGTRAIISDIDSKLSKSIAKYCTNVNPHQCFPLLILVDFFCLRHPLMEVIKCSIDAL